MILIIALALYYGSDKETTLHNIAKWFLRIYFGFWLFIFAFGLLFFYLTQY